MTALDEPTPAVTTRWRTPAGLELLGRAQGSGLQDPPFIVRRHDGQVIQLSELLQLVVEEARTERDTAELADAVSERFGRQLSIEGLDRLITNKLGPAGLIEDAERGLPTEAQRSTPLLALTARRTLLPPRVVRPIAGRIGWLFASPIVLVVLGAFVTLDVTLLRRADLLAALQDLITTPTLLLVLLAMITLGSVLHELGHATACQYGGARTGAIGVGVYLIFPAFYTDVTDSYRLGRGGRLRTDLGGLYFNVLCVLAAGTAYLVTGQGLLLMFVLITHIQMLQQLLPAIRLDGYYVLADLAGVPDLFSRVGPVLKSLIPGRPVDPRVAELRPGARRMVVAWVLVTVPLLLAAYAWLIWNLPFILDTAFTALQARRDSIGEAWSSVDIPMLVLSVLSLVFLFLPLIGIIILNVRIARGLARAGRRFANRTDRSSPKEGPTMSDHPDPDVIDLTAAAFTDELILKPQRPIPTRGWQRAVYVASGRRLNVGPGLKQQQHEELEARLSAPIHGSRRVAVMSRKGGVGKTTMTLALGGTFAELRGDRVIAVDANPDAGNLAHRSAPLGGRTVTDVLRDFDRIDSYSVLREYISQSPESRLEVLASDDDPRVGVALDNADYHRLIGLLDHFYNLILLDTGTGILDSANQGLLQEADELVVVLRAGVDSGRAAALTLDWLDEHGYADLVRHAVVVVNAVRKGVGAPLGAMTRHFEARCSRVVSVPWDPVLETGAETRLSMLAPSTRSSLLEMSAALADNFSERRNRRANPVRNPWLDTRPHGHSAPMDAPPSSNGDSGSAARHATPAT